MTNPFGKPSPELEVFTKDIGTWDAAVEMRSAPGAEPQKSRGIATNRLAYGGKWLLSYFKNETGFEGQGIYGYDPAKKKYTGVWVDPLRTSLAVMEGTYDAAKKTMTFVGELQLADGKSLRWREVTETVDADTQVFRSFMPGPAGEFEMMTVTYKRRRDP